MPNQNTENATAKSGIAVSDHQAPQDGAHASKDRDEARAYVATSYEDATVAPPASGELTDYYDEGEASGGMQQGQDRTRVPEKDVARPQGAKTRAANIEMARSGSPDQGTQ